MAACAVRREDSRYVSREGQVGRDDVVRAQSRSGDEQARHQGESFHGVVSIFLLRFP